MPACNCFGLERFPVDVLVFFAAVVMVTRNDVLGIHVTTIGIFICAVLEIAVAVVCKAHADGKAVEVVPATPVAGAGMAHDLVERCGLIDVAVPIDNDVVTKAPYC